MNLNLRTIFFNLIKFLTFPRK